MKLSSSSYNNNKSKDEVHFNFLQEPRGGGTPGPQQQDIGDVVIIEEIDDDLSMMRYDDDSDEEEQDHSSWDHDEGNSNEFVNYNGDADHAVGTIIITSRTGASTSWVTKQQNKKSNDKKQNDDAILFFLYDIALGFLLVVSYTILRLLQWRHSFVVTRT